MPTKNLRVVITGATSGIGLATAIAFAERGAHLVLGARARTAGIGRRRAALPRCRGPSRGSHRRRDRRRSRRLPGSPRRETLGGIDLWFSSVGIGTIGKYLDVPIADHQQVIKTNLISHMNDAHAVLPIFLDQEQGTWVNMISVGGFLSTPYAAAYATSKFGLRGFSQALRGELSKWPDIHICDVYPTSVDTPVLEHAGNYTGARLSNPPGALAPEAVANAVVRLADKPRNATDVGMPTAVMNLLQFTAPNVSAGLMNAALDRWSRRAEPAAITAGTAFHPPRSQSGVSGDRVSSAGRRKVAVAAGLAVSLSLALSLRVRRR